MLTFNIRPNFELEGEKSSFHNSHFFLEMGYVWIKERVDKMMEQYELNYREAEKFIGDTK